MTSLYRSLTLKPNVCSIADRVIFTAHLLTGCDLMDCPVDAIQAQHSKTISDKVVLKNVATEIRHTQQAGQNLE